MLKRMVLAIGRVLGITPPATLVHLTQDGQNGGNNNTAEQPQPVSKELKRKRSPVQQATKGQSPKAETSCVRTRIKKSSTTGTQQATPARQPAKPKRKPAAKAVPSTIPVKLRKPAQKAAQAARGATGKQSKPTARKTRQHVK
jgi:hypothetical protein